MDEKKEYAKLVIGSQTYDLPIHNSTVGPRVIDVSKLYGQSGYFTYDPGLMSTAACESKITFIDGDEGVLRHRGYNIKELAQEREYLEVCHLLLHGDLPTPKKYDAFKEEIAYHSLVTEQVRNIFGAFRHSAHPMAVILSVVGSLSAFYHDSLDMASEQGRNLAAARMIAKMPTIAAMVYKYSIGQAFVYPTEELSFIENFMNMMFSTPYKKYAVNPIIVKALDQIFILHADHEQNASTSTVRTSASSGANPFACVSAGIASLWGAAHGGANEAVINMLKEIGDVKNIKKYIAKAKDKDDPFRLMGFGHRVYKNYDPRAAVLREICPQVLEEVGSLKQNPLLTIAMELEEIALNDQYFVDRKLYPNVDFYSGIIYQAINIPPQMFTVLFAVARTAGWVSQWKEMLADPALKITRPRQLYTGYVNRVL